MSISLAGFSVLAAAPDGAAGFSWPTATPAPPLTVRVKTPKKAAAIHRLVIEQRTYSCARAGLRLAMVKSRCPPQPYAVGGINQTSLAIFSRPGDCRGRRSFVGGVLVAPAKRAERVGDKVPMTKMLASVTGVEEAEIALSGQVDIIDLKNPSAGALGAAALETIRATVVS
ncbi:MAG: (5-formylfuran-3-yl)methyl phosphate synthase, partial [Mesorhizobium sp.]